MKVILETDVLYQALRSRNGASFYILQLIRNGKINIALSIPVFNEYEDVLKRPENLKKFNLEISDVDKVLTFLAYIGQTYSTYYLFRPNLQDENDNIFIELALSSSSKYIITNNVKDFKKNAELKFESFKILTPSEFVKNWRKKYE